MCARVPAKKPIPGANPRPIIAKILNFRDCDLLLQATRNNGPLMINNTKVSIFPDYTLAVQRKLSFQDVKTRIRAAGLTCFSLFSQVENPTQLVLSFLRNAGECMGLDGKTLS